jgi:hypothetical protein
VAGIVIAPGTYRRTGQDYRPSLWLLPRDGAWIETPLTEGVMVGETSTPELRLRIFLSRERLVEVVEKLRDAGTAHGVNVFTRA